jgi:hypothetical protein
MLAKVLSLDYLGGTSANGGSPVGEAWWAYNEDFAIDLRTSDLGIFFQAKPGRTSRF